MVSCLLKLYVFLKGGPLGIKTHTCTFVKFLPWSSVLKASFMCAICTRGAAPGVCFGHANGVLRICKFANGECIVNVGDNFLSRRKGGHVCPVSFRMLSSI